VSVEVVKRLFAAFAEGGVKAALDCVDSQSARGAAP
jgi:hypothetical protein